MTLLASLLLAATAASSAVSRIDSIALTTVAGCPAVRLAVDGAPASIRVSQHGSVARVSLENARLGPRFAGGQRFSWALEGAAAASAAPRLSRLDVAGEAPALELDLTFSPLEATVEVRQERGAVWLVVARVREARAAAPAPPRVFAALARRTDEPPRPAVEASAPSPEAPQTASPPPSPASTPQQARPAEDVAGLARGLFPGASAVNESAAPDDVARLYPRLFPAGGIETPVEGGPTPEPPDASALRLGPVRLRAAVEGRYVDGDTFLGLRPTRDRFVEVAPKVTAELPLGAGRLSGEYLPVVRALARDERLDRSTQQVGAAAELPLGATVTLHAAGSFAAATLETRLADPGGEYFLGLGRFHRTEVESGARVALLPRLDLELSGRAGRVRFVEPGTFFDHDSRAASAGLGFELAPGLRSHLAYAYDTIPRPPARPEAQARAHSLNVSFDGDLRPLLSGRIGFGYRSQRNPAAGTAGQGWSGLTASGALTQQLGRESRVSLAVSRSTPASGFESNGFYAATSLQLSADTLLPLSLGLHGAVGWQRNAYPSRASETGAARRDRFVDWQLSLRRPLPGRLTLAGSYRRQRRESNLDRFDVDSEGFLLQLEWNALGGSAR